MSEYMKKYGCSKVDVRQSLFMQKSEILTQPMNMVKMAYTFSATEDPMLGYIDEFEKIIKEVIYLLALFDKSEDDFCLGL